MIIFFCSWSVLIIFIAIACYGGKQFGMGYAAEHKGRLSQQLLVRIFSRAAALFATGGDQGATTLSKLGVQFLGLGYCTEQNTDGIYYTQFRALQAVT